MILEKATEGSPATERNTILTKRYWGLDLSGSTQSAGGVDGLLATVATKSSPATAGTETHYYHYDANGNVTETIDANGDLTASYEYGALVSESGSYRAAEGSPDDCGKNNYIFSTKSIDTENGHYYYGYRFYDSNLGRWLNRDPLDEGGGFNLYAFVANNSLIYIDYLGLSRQDPNRGKTGGFGQSQGQKNRRYRNSGYSGPDNSGFSYNGFSIPYPDLGPLPPPTIEMSESTFVDTESCSGNGVSQKGTCNATCQYAIRWNRAAPDDIPKILYARLVGFKSEAEDSDCPCLPDDWKDSCKDALQDK